MNLQHLSRCTGFPPEVLQGFALQGIVPVEDVTTRTLPTEYMFDGQSFMRMLAELKRGK